MGIIDDFGDRALLALTDRDEIARAVISSLLGRRVLVSSSHLSDDPEYFDETHVTEGTVAGVELDEYDRTIFRIYDHGDDPSDPGLRFAGFAWEQLTGLELLSSADLPEALRVAVDAAGSWIGRRAILHLAVPDHAGEVLCLADVTGFGLVDGEVFTMLVDPDERCATPMPIPCERIERVELFPRP